MKFLPHTSRLKVGRLLYILFLAFLYPLTAQQQRPVNKKAFQVAEMDIAKKAPHGYESVATVTLNQPLTANETYEVGFWIFGQQLPDQGYSYPIAIFPSNDRERLNRNSLHVAQPLDNAPTLDVKPPPSYATKGYFTFAVRPKKAYHQITVALKNTHSGKSPIDFKKDITVTGLVVRPLPDQHTKRRVAATNKEISSNPAESTPKVLADRTLMDSQKSYTIHQKSVRMALYDPRNIDQDVVTIYLNDSIIVNSLQLTRKKKFFDIELRPGTNTIALHAENLGEVAPNTAAILIKGEKEEFEAVLASDLGQSQFFTLVCEER